MDKKDLHIRFTKGTGPGGQHKNKVETCVIITHLPTGIKETCQDTRSKLKNLELAKNRIYKRIEKLKADKAHKARNDKRIELIHNPKTVRTYNFARREVVDHRTKKRADIKKVLNGEINLLF